MQRIRHTIRVPHPHHGRVGFTTPAVAIGLLAFMMGMALVLDRIWLETAKLELTSAAESAALAAARELASDDSLLTNSAVELRLNNARQMAASIAAQNFVCGTSVVLNTEPEGDIRFGNLVPVDNGVQFEESDTNPLAVMVTALRTQSNNNPVALFLTGVSGLPYGDVAVRVQATVQNDVIGLKAISGTPIPALPIAIWEIDPSGNRTDTWTAAIESGTGTDNYSFDSETHQVVAEADGIPELVVRTMMTGSDPNNANLQLLDIGTNLSNTEVVRQFTNGLSTDDLQSLDGSIYVGQGTTIDFPASPQFDSNVLPQLQNMIGQCRLCLLYSIATPQRQQPSTISTCTRVVAIRILAVNGNSDGSFNMTIQPTVMTSRNALLASENLTPNADTSSELLDSNLDMGLTPPVADTITTVSSSGQTNVIPNRYVYKLRLTY